MNLRGYGVQASSQPTARSAGHRIGKTIPRGQGQARLFTAVLLALLLFTNFSPARAIPISEFPDNSSQPAASYNIQHVFLVVMENHSYSQIWDKAAARYITALGKRYARATNYYALTHPSLPNYLMMYAGSNYGITRNCIPSDSCHINAVHLTDNLQAKGLKWKGYMESMPAPCTLTYSGKYAPRHNPFIYFDNVRNNLKRCRQHIRPLTDLPLNLASSATTPNFAMIIPNVCNDMHDCSIKRGDDWLKAQLPPILASPACTVKRCLVILTFDEDNGRENNRVLTIFAGSAAKPGAVSAATYNHYSLLRTIEDVLGVPTQTKNDRAAKPMIDMLR